MSCVGRACLAKSAATHNRKPTKLTHSALLALTSVPFDDVISRPPPISTAPFHVTSMDNVRQLSQDFLFFFVYYDTTANLCEIVYMPNEEGQRLHTDQLTNIVQTSVSLPLTGEIVDTNSIDYVLDLWVLFQDPIERSRRRIGMINGSTHPELTKYYFGHPCVLPIRLVDAPYSEEHSTIGIYRPCAYPAFWDKVSRVLANPGPRSENEDYI